MSFPSTVLVYEFFSGGGCPAGELPAGLAAEALGMLWALLTDFRHWGLVRTITALDSRFEDRVPGLNRKTLPADQVFSVSHSDCKEDYLSLLNRCDAAIIIAPETDGVLAWLTAQAEMAGIPILGSSSSAVAAAGDKAACHQLFASANLPNPATHAATFESAHQVTETTCCPFVVKPVDGVGSEGVCLVAHISDFPAALASARRITSRNQVLIQSFVDGTHVSVSLLAAAGSLLPLSLNRQLIEVGSPFKYLGSEVPFDHRACGFGVELACAAVSLIPGLSGYVGVDLVLTEDSAQLIEINPRVTTSYIALRQVTSVNLAKAISEACLTGILPDRVPLSGRAVIKKDDPGSWNLERR
jgi:predicted ATP-grasp superfamily ATP-dependent carboligase